MRSLLRFAPLILVAAALFVIIPTLKQNPASNVVIRKATEMPRMDVGVQLPIHATFTGQRTPAVGQPAELTLVLTSGAADARVRAAITAPASASFGKSPAAWEGTLGALDQAEIPVSVILDGDRGGFVHADITTVLPDGREFTSGTAVFVDPGEPDNPLPEHKTLTEPDGRTLDVVVYRPNNQ